MIPRSHPGGRNAVQIRWGKPQRQHRKHSAQKRLEVLTLDFLVSAHGAIIDAFLEKNQALSFKHILPDPRPDGLRRECAPWLPSGGRCCRREAQLLYSRYVNMAGPTRDMAEKWWQILPD